jgi:hypothetical protein
MAESLNMVVYLNFKEGGKFKFKDGGIFKYG